MGKKIGITGNEAIANAMRLANPDVCGAFPITPATEIMQRFTTFVSNGQVKTEMVLAESEHSAMSACIGASAAGGRVATATAAQGLALMFEMLFIASGLRLPIIMGVANRALSAPLNIHGDHSDGMAVRDCGWIHLYSENAQEAYDNMLQAFRIGEHKDLRLPVMVGLDGFITSHSIQTAEYLDDDVAREFVGEYRQTLPALLDIKHPVSMGSLILTDYYHEYRKAFENVMSMVPAIVEEIGREYEKISGRPYGLYESYRLEDAEIAIVVMSSAAGTSKEVVDEFRDKGVKAGLLKPRLFRPFPYTQIAAALKHLKAVAVLDRADCWGASYGPLFTDVSAALYGETNRPVLVNKIYGLGGRDYMPDQAEYTLNELVDLAKGGKVKALKEYIGVRE
jgi:pyruvate ferredoxin oxidoreductase alpha subunit